MNNQEQWTKLELIKYKNFTAIEGHMPRHQREREREQSAVSRSRAPVINQSIRFIYLPLPFPTQTLPVPFHFSPCVSKHALQFHYTFSLSLSSSAVCSNSQRLICRWQWRQSVWGSIWRGRSKASPSVPVPPLPSSEAISVRFTSARTLSFCFRWNRRCWLSRRTRREQEALRTAATRRGRGSVSKSSAIKPPRPAPLSFANAAPRSFFDSSLSLSL